MNSVYQILSMLSQMGFTIPVLVYTALVLVTLLVLLYIVYRRYFRSKKPRPQPAEKVETTPVVAQKSVSSPPVTEGRATRQRLDQSIRQLIKQLRAHVAGRDYLYEVPWLMLIGEQGTGKTTLLAHTQLNLPLGEPLPSEGGCDAWLFDKGLILEVSSHYILKPEKVTDQNAVITIDPLQPLSDEKGWRTLLELLRHHRPRRPLDGIILTIPCKDLLGIPQNPEILTKKADHLYHKLWQAQKDLGLRLPIYILITQCDQLTGFTHFSATLPEQLRHNLFGWSNPYTLDTSYKSVWLEEAFQTIYRDLNQIQVELVTALSDIPNSDTFLLFPHQFRPVFRNLKFYLDNLFQPSIYHETFFLRGIYFCGDVLGSALTLTRESLVPSDRLIFEPILEEKSKTRQIIFLHHLFRDKLFPEAQIARPVTSVLRKQTRALRFIQVSLVALLIVGIAGQWWAYQRLTQNKEILLPLLSESYKELSEMKEILSKTINNTQQALLYLQSSTAEHFLASVAKVDNSQFFSIFLPISLVNGLNSRIIEALASIYEEFVPNILFNRLDEKITEILNQNQKVNTAFHNGSLFDISEFIAFQKFLDKLQEWQRNVNYYNSAGEKGYANTEDINRLMVYLLGEELGDGKSKYFTFSSELLRAVLAQVQYTSFKPEEYTRRIQEYASILLTQWRERLLKINPLSSEIQEIIKILDTLEEIKQRAELTTRLTTLQANIARLEQLIDHPRWTWIIAHHEKSVELNSLYLKIADISLLGKTFSEDMKNANETSFYQFRQSLINFRSRLIGPILQPVSKQGAPVSKPLPQLPAKESASLAKPNDSSAPANTGAIAEVEAENNVVLDISPNLIDLKNSLEYFMNQKFMVVPGEHYLQTRIPPEMQLNWRLNILQDALTISDSFNQYVKEDLTKVHRNLQPVLRKAGQMQVYQNLFALVAQAQLMNPLSPTLSQAEEVLSSDIQNFSNAIPLLEQIIAGLKGWTEDAVQTINQLEVTQAYNLLTKVDNLLTQDNLYTPVNKTLNGWDGQQALSLVVFGVNDKEELNYYLQLQRDRVSYLAHNYAKPLLTVLLTKPLAGGAKSSVVALKWQRILEELDKYTSKKTANSLTDLEKHVFFDLDKINSSFCFDAAYVETARASGDYFLQKRRYLQNLLSPQCQKLADNQAYERYAVISEFFNQKLAGRFPFASVEASENEVAPETVQEFLQLYATYSQYLQGMLARISGNNTKKAMEFLDKIEKVKVFFEPFLDKPLPLPDPLFEFAIKFRVNRDHEAGANQIMDWQVEIAGQSLQQKNGIFTGRWQLGDPLRISLRWARNSAFRPYLDGMTATSALMLPVQDQAAFYYEGDWALLKLLKRQRSIAGDFDRLEDRQPHTLKLVIPVKQLVAQRPALEPGQSVETEQTPYSVKTEEKLRDDARNINDGQESVINFAEKSTTNRFAKGAPRIFSYQGQYRELFEQTSQTVLFIRVTLLRPGQKEQLRVPDFPDFAPRLNYQSIPGVKVQPLLLPVPKPLKPALSIVPAPAPSLLRPIAPPESPKIAPPSPKPAVPEESPKPEGSSKTAPPQS
ncbi:MAG: hypothetical protein BWK79_00305 [Beggiatoa sp. IS2]|nr:MAG: hypothetical protein BWK79_00305 [Beggiatoa sp. IS2]